MDDSGFLIIGANGQLGKALQVKYPRAKTASSKDLDISDQKAVENFDWADVTHVLNAAGYTNVDGAESEEGRRSAWAINSSGVANISKIASERDMTLVHVSSDYVFDGSGETHLENEVFSPLSVYGASKAAGDIAASLTTKHYIIRSSWVIGDGNNFVRTMIGLASRDISPTVVHDQVGRLTFTETMVEAIDHLLSSGAYFGTYNVSNSGDPVSWADITRAIFSGLGREDLTVTDTTTEGYFAGKAGIAPRPKQSTLDLSKIQNSGYNPSDWKESLRRYIKEQSS